MFNWLKKKTFSDSKSRRAGARLQVEVLESRLVPYSASGNAWAHPELITISFVPDGTVIDGQASDMQAKFNTKFGSSAAWQNVFKKAAQVWAEQTNINIVFVSDNGAEGGSGDYQQGDPGFGDIRIGGYDFGDGSILASANMPPPVNNYSIGGDISFNTGVTFNIGSTFDLFSVAAHEFGHTLGLYHGSSGTIMASSYSGTLTALATDDINGIRNIYSADAARAKDSYDLAAANSTFATASNITATIDAGNQTALLEGLDLTVRTDVDWYKFTVPAGSSTTLTARAVATGLSMLNPRIEIYNSSNVLKASNNGGSWGSTASATVTGVAAGQVWYIKVSSTDSVGQFKTGKYALVLNMGADPTVPLPNTQVLNGDPLTSGGGQALAYASEFMVNTTTGGNQVTDDSQPAMAADSRGNYVVVWSSHGQDATDTWGVYAQRFDAFGVAHGSEFRVNTTTAGDQRSPSVAMQANGDFVVAWSSGNQDASNSWGVFAQRFNASGVPQGSEFRINTTTAGDQMSASVAMANITGDFVVTWSSYNQNASDSWGVYAQRFDAAGTAQGGEFRVNTANAGDQTKPSVAMGRTGDFIVSWSNRNSPAANDGFVDDLLSNTLALIRNDSSDIHAQRFDAAGLALGSVFQVNTTTAGNQEDSTGAIAANGIYVVVWTSIGQDGSGAGVYAQRFNTRGEAIGAEFLVNSTILNDQTTPSVATDHYGGFIVAWASQWQDGSGFGIYAQQFGSSGAPLEHEFRINSTRLGEQVAPAVVMDQQGNLTFVWSGYGSGDARGVFSRRFSTKDHIYEAMHATGLVDEALSVEAQSPFASPPASLWDLWTAASAQATYSANSIDQVLSDDVLREVLSAHEITKTQWTRFFQDHESLDKNTGDAFFANLAANLADEDGDIGTNGVRS